MFVATDARSDMPSGPSVKAEDVYTHIHLSSVRVVATIARDSYVFVGATRLGWCVLSSVVAFARSIATGLRSPIAVA